MEISDRNKEKWIGKWQINYLPPISWKKNKKPGKVSKKGKKVDKSNPWVYYR